MFKKLFGSEENKPILQGLIHDVWGYDLPLDEIRIVYAYSIMGGPRGSPACSRSRR
jgi:hypothetical protein